MKNEGVMDDESGESYSSRKVVDKTSSVVFSWKFVKTSLLMSFNRFPMERFILQKFIPLFWLLSLLRLVIFAREYRPPPLAYSTRKLTIFNFKLLTQFSASVFNWTMSSFVAIVFQQTNLRWPTSANVRPKTRHTIHWHHNHTMRNDGIRVRGWWNTNNNKYNSTTISHHFLSWRHRTSNISKCSGHCYKLYKGYSQVNTHKYFFTNRICDIWNGLPSSVVEASSLTVFKRMLDHADLARYCIDIR